MHSSGKNVQSFGNFDQEKDGVAEREKEDGDGKLKNSKICENDIKDVDQNIVEVQFRFKDLQSDNGKHDIQSNDVSTLIN